MLLAVVTELHGGCLTCVLLARCELSASPLLSASLLGSTTREGRCRGTDAMELLSCCSALEESSGLPQLLQ